MADVTVLAPSGLARRALALDALYLNADRWLARFIASGKAEDRWRAHLAWRAYERMRDTPYAVAGESNDGG